jgi:uncharacterized protein YqeY
MGSPIFDTILADIKKAMKAREGARLTTLRTLHAEIKNVEIRERREATDGDVAGVLARGIKQRTEAMEQYRRGGREDLAAAEQAEIDLYSSYLPRQLDRSEIEQIVDKAIAETQAAGKKDRGTVMKVVMPQVKGRADGKVVNEIVSARLG